MTELFILFLTISTGIAFTDWRKGLFLVVLAGALQDPIRKMMPGAPAIMVLGFLPIWIASCFNFFMRERFAWRRLKMAYKQLAPRMVWFIASLLPGTAVLFLNGLDMWKVAVIGLFGYLAPIVAIMLGFLFVREMSQLEKFITFYCVVTSLFLIGSVIEYLHILPDWTAIGTKVLDMRWIRFVPGGGSIDLIAGFYRSPDVMGWHASSLVMFGLTMIMFRRGANRWLWIGVALWGGLCLLISGRNKMILMPVVWLIVVSASYWFKGKTSRIIKLALVSGIAVIGVFIAAGNIGVEEGYFTYTAYGATNLYDRLETHAWYDVLATYDQSGFFGNGIGTASQGVQHADVSLQRSWQEGGVDKILVELGMPGLFFAVLFAISLARSLFRSLRQADTVSPSFIMQVGLLGFIAANASSFIISHQAYSDAFIVTLTAFFIGVALSGPLWASGIRQEQDSAARSTLSRYMPLSVPNSRIPR